MDYFYYLHDLYVTPEGYLLTIFSDHKITVKTGECYFYIALLSEQASQALQWATEVTTKSSSEAATPLLPMMLPSLLHESIPPVVGYLGVLPAARALSSKCLLDLLLELLL